VRVTGNTVFTFWETPPGTARALKDWYWPGDNFGQEFPYPKNLKQTAQVTPAPAPPAPPAPAPQVQEQPAPQPQAQVQEQEQQEVAQATPPPAPPAPQAQPETPAPAPPQELPKTASPYPLVGLIGLFSLGLYGLLRAKRPA
jgi:hypothetical protein